MSDDACMVKLPLGISRIFVSTDTSGLSKVLGDFDCLTFNIARTSLIAFSISIRHFRKTRHGISKEIYEPVSGLIGDTMQLAKGELVKIISMDQQVKLEFTKPD